MISVIITTKNESGKITNLLDSISKQKYKKYEVLVVDNKSTDNTKVISKKHGARVFDMGPERSSQRNFGVKKARGGHVLILDADMSLSPKVLSDLSKVKEDLAVIPEKSYGSGFWTKFKVFEREMYVGDQTIEAPRYFKRDLFLKFGGYDENITGPEDYDLPLRMKKSGVKVGRINSYILHNEGVFSPIKSAKKKFYYASHAKSYIKKHPDMLIKQGNLIFRWSFLRNWKKIIRHPFLFFGMFVVRVIEMAGAFCGLIYSVIIRK